MENISNRKITIFGDSIPKGIVYENNKLEKLSDNVVSLIAKHYKIDIENISYYGQTITRLLDKALIDEYLKSLDVTKENIAVISLGGNDSDYDWKKVATSPLTPHFSKTPPNEFEKLLDNIISRLKSKNIRVILTNIPPVCSKKYFDNVIAKTADADKVLKFLRGDIDNIYRHQELYNLIITKCAIKNNCQLIDIREHFLKDISYLNSFCEDGIHPNRLGHRQMANSIIAQLG